MAAYVGNIQTKARCKRVLDANVPILHVRITEVTIYHGEGTGRSRISSGVVAVITALDCVGPGKNGCMGPVILPIEGDRRPGATRNGHGSGCNLAGARCRYSVHHERRSGRNGAYPAVGPVLTACYPGARLHGEKRGVGDAVPGAEHGLPLACEVPSQAEPGSEIGVIAV